MNGKIRFTTLLLFGFASACASGGADPSVIPREAPPRAAQRGIRLNDTETLTITTESGFHTRAFAATRADTWTAVNEAIVRLELPVSARNARTFELQQRSHAVRRIDGARMSRYVDCGTSMNGPLANSYDITIAFTVRVGQGEVGLSTVATNVQAFGVPRATSGGAVPCNSTLRLEKRIVELASEILGKTAR